MWTRRAVLLSIPHAALCVSGHIHKHRGGLPLRVSMPHAALCVSGLALFGSMPKCTCFNAARSIVCVGTHISGVLEKVSIVSMPHAALCVSGHPIKVVAALVFMFQCRTQHCVCRDLTKCLPNLKKSRFQCRTQHCVCRDSVSRSPCPARAEKVFWKDALFCAVFGVCG